MGSGPPGKRSGMPPERACAGAVNEAVAAVTEAAAATRRNWRGIASSGLRPFERHGVSRAHERGDERGRHGYSTGIVGSLCIVKRRRVLGVSHIDSSAALVRPLAAYGR